MWRSNCSSFFPNLESFKVKVLLLVFWAGVTWGLVIQMSIGFNNFYYRVVQNSIQLFAFSRALLAPWNLMWPALPPRAVDQVNFMALVCSRMTFHEFILWPGPCRGQTGEFVFFVLFLLASAHKGFTARFEPLLCADLADWWRSPDFFFVGSCYFRHPASGKFPQQYRGARRTQRAPWGLG